MFSFKLWLEELSKDDNDKVVGYWDTFKGDKAEDLINLSEVDNFTKAFTDKNKDTMRYALSMGRREINVYKEPISDNLLKFGHEDLKDAFGQITSIMHNREFSFDNGAITIIVPYMTFDKESVLLLRSIIVHECVHAINFVTQSGDDLPGVVFDESEYLASWDEVRSLVTQLKVLVKDFGTPEAVAYQLASSRHFGIKDTLQGLLIPVMLDFMKRNLTMEDTTNSVFGTKVIQRGFTILVEIYRLLLFKKFVKFVT